MNKNPMIHGQKDGNMGFAKFDENC